MLRIRWVALSLAMTCAVSAVGSTRATRQAPSETDTLRVSTRLVQVQVVVRDDDGPVDDLSIDDFRVFDDGVERTLTTFDRVRSSDPVPDSEPAVPLASGAITNRPRTSASGGSGATILLIDHLNMQTIDQKRAADQARKFLDSFDGSHAVAIYELNRGLQLVQDYTRDRETLLAALATVDLRVSGEFSASLGEGASGGLEAGRDQVGLDQALVIAQSRAGSPNATIPGASPMELGILEVDALVSQVFLNDRIRVTANALEAIAEHLSPIPGRKNLVWLAGSFPFAFEPRSYFTVREIAARTLGEVERAARVVTDSNVAVYPISVVGLLAPEFNQPSMPAGADAGAFRFRRRMSADQARFDTEPDVRHVMNHIADFTGGEAFYWTNGIAESIEAAARDSEVVYTLGFSPDDREDGEFHELRVDVERDGVEVQHRAGYYGFGAPEDADREDDADAIVALLTSPVNATGLEVVASNQPLFESTRYVTVIQVGLDDVALAYRDGRWMGELEIATLEIDSSSGEPVAGVGLLEVDLSEADLASARESGFEVLRFVNGDGTAGWLRIVVRDTSGRSSGSLWVPLD